MAQNGRTALRWQAGRASLASLREPLLNLVSSGSDVHMAMGRHAKANSMAEAEQSVERPFAVDHRLVLGIAVPMTLAYLTTPLLGVVDTAVVGQFGDAALLGGLAAGTIVFDVVFASFNFLRAGTTGLVAQAFGRGDRQEERAVFCRAAAIAIVAGLVLILLAPAVAALGGVLIDAEPRVTAAMKTYVAIRLYSAPAALINYAVLGYLLGRGEARLGLALQILLNGVNIALSILFGLHFGWGVAGVAWGTVCGEAVAAVAGVALLVVRFRRMPPLDMARTFHRGPLRRMLHLNRDIMIRSFALMAAFALFTRQGAQLGTRDARRQCGAHAFLHGRRLFPRRLRDGSRTARRPRCRRPTTGPASTPLCG